MNRLTKALKNGCKTLKDGWSEYLRVYVSNRY